MPGYQFTNWLVKDIRLKALSIVGCRETALQYSKSAFKSRGYQTSFYSHLLLNLSAGFRVAPPQAAIRCITRSELLGERLRTGVSRYFEFKERFLRFKSAL